MNMDCIENKLKECLSEERYKHTLGCAHCALGLGRDISWRHVVESTATGKQAQDGEDTDEGYGKTLHGGLLQTECFCSPYRPIPKKVYPTRPSF